MLSSILSILWLSVTEFVSLIGGLVIGGFALGFLERLTNRQVFAALGEKGIYMTAWLGTPVHELGHALMCVIFRHKVTEIRLLQKRREDGTIGYVRHTYSPDSLYQQIGNFYIGLAPLISGSLAVLACAYFLLPDSSALILSYFTGGIRAFSLFDTASWQTLGTALVAIIGSLLTWENLFRPSFWLFVILVLCISSRMSLSSNDIRGARSGASALFFCFILVNSLLFLLDPVFLSRIMAGIARFNAWLLILLGLSVFFSFLNLILSSLICMIRRGAARLNHRDKQSF
ncbi:hypothetical protein EWH99_02105 [Sporolactobacillus sp. THM7-7]|nr:hypothetical protein EWH99_02105 [Sporolactobacillus sp. THM7-7]